MFKPEEKVRIRASHIHTVKGYQIKALGWKRLIGKVVTVNGSSCQVDFTQEGMPLLSNGKRPGEAVQVNRSSSFYRADGFFPFEILERA